MAAGRVQDKKFTAETRCMKFSISRDALLKPLSLVAGVVERRQTLPVLSNVLITLESALGGGVLLRCRDGCLRDMASLHGTYRIVDETDPALDALIDGLGSRCRSRARAARSPCRRANWRTSANRCRIPAA